jgi:hypothetical protein
MTWPLFFSVVIRAYPQQSHDFVADFLIFLPCHCQLSAHQPQPQPQQPQQHQQHQPQVPQRQLQHQPQPQRLMVSSPVFFSIFLFSCFTYFIF